MQRCSSPYSIYFPSETDYGQPRSSAGIASSADIGYRDPRPYGFSSKKSRAGWETQRGIPPPRNTIEVDLEQITTSTNRQTIDLDKEPAEIRPVILDDGEVINIEELEPELERDIFEINESIQVEAVSGGARKRNAPIKDPYREVGMADIRGGEILLPGYTVELMDGRFLEIKLIVENIHTKAVTLRGWELKRTKDLGGELIFRLNEVCYIFDVDLDDTRPVREQSVIEVDIQKVKKIRKLVCTNYHFPAFRFNVDELPLGTQRQRQWHVEAEEGLVARWKYVTTFKSSQQRERQSEFSANYYSRTLVRLDQNECGKTHYLPMYALRCQWRGDTSPAGSRERSKYDEARGATSGSKLGSKPICIDISDDETFLPRTQASLNVMADTLVPIKVSSSDFNNVEPWTFMGNIRRRYDTQVHCLQTNNAATPTNGGHSARLQSNASTSKSTNYGGESRKAMHSKRSGHIAGKIQKKPGDTYSFADACKHIPTNFKS